MTTDHTTTRGSAPARYTPTGGHGNAEWGRHRDPWAPDADELEEWTVANRRARDAAYGSRVGRPRVRWVS